ncbi:MAG: hypothetical protein QOE62_647 [Actinomycetota bacterium]|nr:hypothetical protein [Actinomycetota bacterium]
MFRFTLSLSGPAERERVTAALQGPAIGDVRIVSAFADETKVEAYLEAGGRADLREVAADVARRLGVTEYEVTRVDPICHGATRRQNLNGSAHRPAESPSPDRAPRRPADITQVRIDLDDRTLSVQTRHRPHETVETIEVMETDDAVMITAFVAPPDNLAEQYASFGIAFSWMDTVLERPLGNRRVIRPDRDSNTPASRSR